MVAEVALSRQAMLGLLLQSTKAVNLNDGRAALVQVQLKWQLEGEFGDGGTGTDSSHD